MFHFEYGVLHIYDLFHIFYYTKAREMIKYKCDATAQVSGDILDITSMI